MIEKARDLLSRRDLWPDWTKDGATRRDLERLATQMKALRLTEEKRARQMLEISELASALRPKVRY